MKYKLEHRFVNPTNGEVEIPATAKILTLLVHDSLYQKLEIFYLVEA